MLVGCVVAIGFDVGVLVGWVLGIGRGVLVLTAGESSTGTPCPHAVTSGRKTSTKIRLLASFDIVAIIIINTYYTRFKKTFTS